MQNVVGIRLKDTGKIYDFDPSGLELKAGDMVVVDTERGPVIGKVVRESYEIDVTQQIRKIIRKASKEDVEKVKENEGLRKEAYEFCRAKIKEMNLPMRLIETELSLDGSKAVFYFTSEGRVDFRELVKELAAKFRIRIEMKQIGVRDEARLIGGFGCCGRTLCCETFIKDFEPVSIRMAKKQELALNPAKISGVCGRLMCCLVFEYEIYDEIKKDTNELRNIEKPYPTDLDQVTETPSSINNKEVSSTVNIQTKVPIEVSPKKETVKSPPLNPTGERDKKGGEISKVYPEKRMRKRKRRRRRRDSAGSSSPNVKGEGNSSPQK